MDDFLSLTRPLPYMRNDKYFKIKIWQVFIADVYRLDRIEGHNHFFVKVYEGK